MQQFEIKDFDPSMELIQKALEDARDIAAVEIVDDEQYKMAKSTRLDLRTMRTTIEKSAKEMRDAANKFSKDVIAKERSYTDKIDEWEKAIKERETAYEEKVKREERRAALPQRLEELAKLGVELSEDEILSMDFDAFNKYVYDTKFKQMEERERIAKAKEDEANRQIKEAEDKAEKERIAKEAAEKAAIETEARLRKEQEEKEEKEAERLQAEKDAEEKSKADLEKKKKYMKRLEDNKFDATTDKVEKESGKMVIYRKVSEFLIS